MAESFELLAQRLLWSRWGRQRELAFPNIDVYGNESDWLSVTGAGYADEYEVKASRSDFLADRRKSRHLRYTHRATWRADHGLTVNDGYGQPDRPFTSIRGPYPPEVLMPNRFWYVAPFGLLTAADLPDYAGLVEVREDKNGGHYLSVFRRAPLLHKGKFPEKHRRAILTAAYWRHAHTYYADRGP